MYETKPYFYGTGRRKHSVARVRVYNGTGKVTINGRDINDYFGLETLKLLVNSPLVLTENEGKFDVVVNVVAVRLVVGHAVDEQPLNEVYLGIDGAVAAELVPENSCKVKVFAVVVRRIRVSDVFCDYLLLLPEDGQPLLRYPECIRIEKCHIFSSLSWVNSTKWHTIPYSYSYYNYTPFHNILQQFFHDIFLHNVESVY